MTRVDFYILPESQDTAVGPVMTVCRLCEKAVAAGTRVYVRAPLSTMAAEIDDALWTYKQGGFVSHERDTGKAVEDPQPSILIGNGDPPATHLGILVNLGEDVPLHFSRFERVLEIVPASPADRASSRVRFKFYRDRGYELATHTL